MTGLEKIVQQIIEDAQKQAEEKRQEIEAEAKEIVNQAKISAGHEVDRLKQEAQEEAKRILARAMSSVQFERRNRLLSFKQDYIESLIDEVKKGIAKSSDDEYFKRIYMLVKKYARPEPGVIYVGKKDMGRLPADFTQQLNAAAGAEIKLGDQPRALDGGFILSYNDIDINCSFDAIFAEHEEALRDAASEGLF